MTSTLISVLMATYNRADWLPEVLDTIVNQQLDDSIELEVVVVDNNSDDNTREVLQSFAAQSSVPVKYVHEVRQGDVPARNAGLPHCTGDWVAFIDDDELAEPCWIQGLLAAAKQTGSHMIGGAVHLDATDEEIERMGMDIRRSLREKSPATFGTEIRKFPHRESPGTGNLLVSRELIDLLGLFDEEALGADYDYYLKAQEAGYEAYYAPGAVIRHRVPENRLAPEFIDWDSYRTGVMLAYHDEQNSGKSKVLLWGLARILQGVAITIPKLAFAKISKNQAAMTDRRIRWIRLKGYLQAAGAIFFPWLISRDGLDEYVDFTRGREIGGPQQPNSESKQLGILAEEATSVSFEPEEVRQ